MRRSILQFLYNFMWHIFLPLWFLFHLPGFIRDKSRRKAVKDRLSLYPCMQWNQKPVVWFHGSSLGEVHTLIPFMKTLKEKFPQSQVLSYSTPRGEYIARQNSKADLCVYLPLDISYIVRRSLRRIQPNLLIILETEIWPNLFWECASLHIPLFVISGRISTRSFPRYCRAASFFRSVLAEGNFLMQSQEDMDRIIAIGAPKDKVSLSGDIKLDGLRTELTSQEIQILQETFTLCSPVIVAGSTHPGEEQILLGIYKDLRLEWPDLTMILAPRHLNRMESVRSLAEKMEIEYTMRSSLPKEKNKGVILLDSYGELSKIYWLANIVFVGGTMVPVGGHNLMEPAALGKPVLFGPHIDNCKKQAQLILERHAGYLCYSTNQLKENMAYLLKKPDTSHNMGKNGQIAVQSNQGAIAKCIAGIEKFL